MRFVVMWKRTHQGEDAYRPFFETNDIYEAKDFAMRLAFDETTNVYVQDTRRLMRTQFVSGLFRGMGMAVGFTILGAVLVMLLQALAQRNLPVIGDFLAQLVAIVQSRLE